MFQGSTTPNPPPPRPMAWETAELVITYSLLDHFRNCRKLAQFRYVDQIVPNKRDRAIYLGSTVHKGLHIWGATRSWERVEAFLESCDCEDKPMAWALLKGYTAKYAEEPYKEVGSELIFRGKFSWLPPNVVCAGKLDNVVSDGSENYLRERKTTSRFDGGYLERLYTDLQVQWYYLCRELVPIKLAGVVYDILEKPQIRQKKAETGEEFRERLLSEVSYHREQLYISSSDISQLRRDLVELISQYMDAKKRGVFYRNTGHCFKWNKPCAYFDLCRSGESEAVRENLYRREPAHQELQEEVLF